MITRKYIIDPMKKITKTSPDAVRGFERHNIFRHYLALLAKNRVNGDILEFDSFEGLPRLNSPNDAHPSFTPFA